MFGSLWTKFGEKQVSKVWVLAVFSSLEDFQVKAEYMDFDCIFECLN